MIQELNIEVKQSRLDVTEHVYSHTTAPLKGTEINLNMMIIKDSPQGAEGVWTLVKKPCIIWIMGGGWLNCPREKALPFLIYFARRGYVVASIQVRSSLEANWPAQITDIQTAVRYLRAHADKLGIDADHIAVTGLSSGGHLTTMTAMNPEEYSLDEWSGYSSEVQCAVEMFGPMDLFTIEEQRKENGIPYENPPASPDVPNLSPEEILLGGKLEEKKEGAKDLNPITHITERACPLLLFHGKKDELIPYQQGIQLHDALNAAGHPTDLYLIEDAVHGDYRFFQEEIQEMIIEFLDKHMKTQHG